MMAGTKAGKNFNIKYEASPPFLSIFTHTNFDKNLPILIDAPVWYKPGSSSSYNSWIMADDAHYSCTTSMFNGTVHINNGTLKSPIIIINDKAKIHFDDNFVIKGKVYMVNNGDFYKIAKLWTNKGVEKFLNEKSFIGTEYNMDSYSTHEKQVTELCKAHYEIEAILDHIV